MALEKLNALLNVRSQWDATLPTGHVPGAQQVADRTVEIRPTGANKTLAETSTPPIRQLLVQTISLTGSPITLDLTAAAILGADSGGSPAASEDLTGRRVVWIEARTPATNVSPVTIGPGASAYPIFGSGNTVELPAGESQLALGNFANPSNLPAIGASAIQLAVDGASGDSVTLVIGFD